MRKIKKNDNVEIICGKDKGKSGKVVAVVAAGKKLIVENINLVKRHQKPSAISAGGIVEKSLPLDLSKVMLVCPFCKQKTKVARNKKLEEKRVRSCKKCGEILDQK